MFLLSYQLGLETVCVSSACLRPLAEKRFSDFSCMSSSEDQVKDAVRRDLVAAYILCDTAPQAKRSVIEGCYQLVFIGPEILLSKGWKNVLVLIHTECFYTDLVADLLFYVQRYH